MMAGGQCFRELGKDGGGCDPSVSGPLPLVRLLLPFLHTKYQMRFIQCTKVRIRGYVHYIALDDDAIGTLDFSVALTLTITHKETQTPLSIHDRTSSSSLVLATTSF